MRPALWLCPVLALALGAQDADPRYMGVQVRAHNPVGDLKDQLATYGMGASLFVEHQLEDSYAVRMVGAVDMWGKGVSGGLTGDTRARAYSLSVEGLKFLRPDDEPNLLGPYFVASVGGYGWELTQNSQTRRTFKAGGSLGFGYRINTRLDVEVRGHYCPVEKEFQAGSVSFGLGFRF